MTSKFNVIDGEWPQPGSKLDKFFEYEQYTCHFNNCEDGVYDIILEAVEDGKNIAKEIVAAGLAAEETVPTGIGRSYFYLHSFGRFFVNSRSNSFIRISSNQRKPLHFF